MPTTTGARLVVGGALVISTHIDMETGLRSHCVIGKTDPVEIRTEIDRIFSEPDFDPEAPALWDFREVAGWDLSMEDVRGLAITFSEHWGKAASGRAAIVVSRDLLFGQVRQFLALTGDDRQREVEVFRDPDEALAWLRADAGRG